MIIQEVKRSDYNRLIEIWESSVRATHNFLPDKNIKALKPLILEHYFDAVELRCIKNNNTIMGFIGVADNNIEMLFVDPKYFGQGVGKALIESAIKDQTATKVDVNEQNPKAIRFYEKMGFNKTGYSSIDGQGNPFPLLHMELHRVQ